MVISSSVTRKLVTPSPLEKAIGGNRFVRTLPFRQIKHTDKSKFEADKLRFIGEIEILKCQRKTKQI